jgi:hypothetical protein
MHTDEEILQRICQVFGVSFTDEQIALIHEIHALREEEAALIRQDLQSRLAFLQDHPDIILEQE